MKILFLADPAPDYVADGLFHGLRELLGADVVDHPRRDPLYRGAAGDELYGRGFGLYGLLEDLPVDRTEVWEREWDLIVCAVMWRDWPWWRRALRAFGSDARYAFVDGGDLLWTYPIGPAWLRPSSWPLPRTRNGVRFKREWRRWSVAPWVHPAPLAIAYPAEKLVDAVPSKTQAFGSHVVDLEVGARLGQPLEHNRQYVFSDERSYLADLRAARFGVTTKRAGWDALRHYEIAGAGAVPCFRGLRDKPATCAPWGLVPGVNCLAYRNAEDLLGQVSRVGEDHRLELADGALRWAHENTTRRRAEQFLQRALA